MKQKIIYLVLLLAGMHLLALSKQCAIIVKSNPGSKQEVKKTDSKGNAGEMEEDISDLSLSPVNMLLFKL